MAYGHQHAPDEQFTQVREAWRAGSEQRLIGSGPLTGGAPDR
ncbi:hypothetical protein [Streptomyces acidicola]|nr:hypothetical protein [Streptomyces acidicola]